MAKFEVVSKYKDAGLPLPVRKTEHSAGYDFVAAEDTVIPPFKDLRKLMEMEHSITLEEASEFLFFGTPLKERKYYTLDEIAATTKKTRAKPSLVSTGMKCQLEPGTYLELTIRSSSPLKYWLLLANGVGVIDADYYNNPDNEGEIFFQLINLSPFPIRIQKGEAIGQGIIKSYLITEADAASGSRLGGFGSTGI